MSSTRKIAVVTGVLLIAATVINILASALTPALTGADYLARLSAQPNLVAGSALLYLISDFASAGIAVALYPVLKGRNAGLALGSVIFRALETAFYMVSVVGLLSLLALAHQFTAAEAVDRSALQAIGDLLVSARNSAVLLGVFAFCVGSLLYYTLFFQSQLIPRWLSGWGIVAIILMMAACVLTLFSGSSVAGYILLAFPIFLQEMVLAVWLIVKGFEPYPGAQPDNRVTA